MEENVWTKKRTLLIIGFGILAIVLLVIRFIGGNKDDSEISIVKSSSKFYTVSGCVNRYLNYLYSEDVDNLMLLIDKSYKNKNNLNSKSFFNKIDKLDNMYTFEARKMYEQVINNNVTRYYVKGYLIKESINSDYNDKQDYYIIVNLDTKNFTYSINPYDGDIFINGGKI